MPGVKYGATRNTGPQWNVDDFGPLNLIAGGGDVEPSEFTAQADGRIYIPAGTFLGRTTTERDSGVGYGPADFTTDGDDIYLLAFDVHDANESNDCELYRHARQVNENFIPDWGALADTEKAKVRELYVCLTGAP